MASRGRGWQRRRGLWGIDPRLWSWKFERDSSSVLLENKRAEANFSKTAVIQSGGNMEHVTEDVPKLELGDFPPHPGGCSSAELPVVPGASVIWDVRCRFTCSVGCLEPGNPGRDCCFEAHPYHHTCLVKVGQRRDLSTGVLCLGYCFLTGRERDLLVLGLFPSKCSLSILIFFKTVTNFDIWLILVAVLVCVLARCASSATQTPPALKGRRKWVPGTIHAECIVLCIGLTKAAPEELLKCAD